MKTKSTEVKKADRQRQTRTAKTGTRRREPKVAFLHRIGPSEFSCGIDDTRALLDEESLDERERRG